MGFLGHVLSIKSGVPFSQLVKDKNTRRTCNG